jgi:2-dehydro-3-deoxygalactonokinase
LQHSGADPRCDRALTATPVPSAAYIAADWGNTHARFWLCGDDGAVIDTRAAPGAKEATSADGGFPAAFDVATAGWPDHIPAVMCGMVGSNFGWVDAGYRDVPILLDTIAADAVRIDHRGRAIAIVPGIKGINAFGLPDTVRGEEVQMLGAAMLSGRTDATIICPGTHNKWARVAGGAVTNFHSSVTGELFALLAAQSILVAPGAALVSADNPGFARGVALVREHSAVGLETLVYAARGFMLTGDLAARDTASFLSGVIIGSDLRTGLTAAGGVYDAPILCVCSDKLAALYAVALTGFRRTSQHVAGDDAALAGLNAAYRQLD